MAKTIYGAVRLDKLQAVYVGNLASVRVGADTDNGRITTLGALEAANREVYAATKPTDVTKDEILLIASPELTYLNDDLIVNFTNKAVQEDGRPGKPARAYHYTVGDIVTVTDDNIDGTTVVGQFLIPKNGSDKLTVSATDTDTRFLAVVIEKTKIYGYNATAYRVVRV